MISFVAVRWYLGSYALLSLVTGEGHDWFWLSRWIGIALALDLAVFGLEARRRWYEMKLESLSRRT